MGFNHLLKRVKESNIAGMGIMQMFQKKNEILRGGSSTWPLLVDDYLYHLIIVTSFGKGCLIN